MDNDKCKENGTDDHLIQNVEQTYQFTIESLLYYQRLFEYSGDILQLLALPYNMFQDLIIKQIALKKKENEQERDRNQNRYSNRYPKMKRFAPPGAGFHMPGKIRK